MGYLGPSWANLDLSGPFCASLAIQGHCQPFWAILRHSQPFWAIQQHSGPFLKAISSPYLHFADRFLVKNTFHADSFYVDHRARENKQELKGSAKRRPPPRGPKGPLGPGGALCAPPWALGVGGGGWGHAETRTSRTHERAKTCTCKARRKQARVDGNYPQGKTIVPTGSGKPLGCLPDPQATEKIESRLWGV